MRLVPRSTSRRTPCLPPCLDRSMDLTGGGPPIFSARPQTSTTTGSTIGRRLSRS
jgi:hypothetical protein